MSKKRNRALRGKQLVREENLSPGIAAGLTQGVPKEEVLARLAAEPSAPSGVELIRHMREVEHVSRVPLPKFVADEEPSNLVIELPDGRKFRDVEKVFQPEVIEALRSGMICLRCLEPQASPFGDSHLPGCEGVSMHGERYMRDRQTLDFSMEIREGKHLGPALPMAVYLEEQDIALEKSLYEQARHDGKSPMKGLR